MRFATSEVTEESLHGSQVHGMSSALREILVPLDGSAAAERVLPVVESLARATGAQVVLLSVVPDVERIAGDIANVKASAQSAPSPIRVVQRSRREAESYLANLARRLRAEGIAVHHELLTGDAAHALARRARSGEDVVAIATQAQS
jgi:nucleotide-binding universal stress UspA family protein